MASAKPAVVFNNESLERKQSENLQQYLRQKSENTMAMTIKLKTSSSSGDDGGSTNPFARGSTAGAKMFDSDTDTEEEEEVVPMSSSNPFASAGMFTDDTEGGDIAAHLANASKG